LPHDYAVDYLPLIQKKPVHNIDSGKYFDKIQDAIDDGNTQDYNTITVDSGTYHEYIVVNKRLTLQGVDTGQGKPVIDADGSTYAVYITLTNLGSWFEGFVVTNASDYGIMADVNDITIMNNTISNIGAGSNGYGIYLLSNADTDQIYNNTISNNSEGIRVSEASGVTIHHNTITNNRNHGIYLNDDANDNVIDSNTVTNNGGYGIYLWQSQGNYIYNNYFNNTRNAYDDVTYGINNWNITKTMGTNIIGGPYIGGNYWDDYTGFDTSVPADGIGDISLPYTSGGDILLGGDALPLTNKTGTLPDIYVDDNAPPGWYNATHIQTIQEGIDAASEGNTIYVYSGTYTENVVVYKALSLIGENKDSTIIDGDGFQNGVTITAGQVTITGFTIQGHWDGIYCNWVSGCTIYDTIIQNNGQDGIEIDSSSNCNIYGNVIRANPYDGISVWGSTHCVFSGNTLANNGDGMLMSQFSDGNKITGNTVEENNEGIIIDGAYNMISQNTFTNNTGPGIDLLGDSYHPEYNTHNVVYNNTFTSNNPGISLYSSVNNCSIVGNNVSFNANGIELNNGPTDCTIANNNVSYNFNEGIGMHFASGNRVYHNTIIGNTPNAYDPDINTWDDGPLYGGNYWSDYTGEDLNGDGFGDTPYTIPGSNQDHYPLMSPYSPRVLNQNTSIMYSTIQDAINAADSGNILIAFSGIYHENVIVNKQVSLIGEDRSGVIVDGQEANDFNIQANNVKIAGFTILNGWSGVFADGYYNIEVTDNNVILNNGIAVGDGIYIVHTNNDNIHHNLIAANVEDGITLAPETTNTVVHDNVFTLNGGTGVYIHGSADSNTVTNNAITQNDANGVYMASSSNNNILSNMIRGNGQDGIDFNDASYNYITGNNISDNSWCGIALHYDAMHNQLIGNTVTANNDQGIFLEASSDNTIQGNIISANLNTGIGLIGGSANNLIYNNIFNNTNNAYDEGTNTWNSTKTSGTNIIGGPYLGGNYWSDYTGEDTTGDGLGEDPYFIEGGFNQDNHPLVMPQPNNPPNTPNNLEPPNGYINATLDTNLYWTGGDQDASDTVSYTIFFGTDADPPEITTIGPYDNSTTIREYDLGTLNYNTLYYWKIIATDNHNATAAGPIWHFTTQQEPTYTISGTIYYEGTSLGQLIIGYFDEYPSGQAPYLGALIPSPVTFPVTYTISGLTDDTYYVLAFLDYDEDVGPPEPDEPIGVAINNTLQEGFDPILINGANANNVDITLWAPNLPPYEPHDPLPPDGATDVSINTDLSWTGGDQDVGDTVTYDVYFGTTNPPSLVMNNQSTTTYSPGTLTNETTYYWKIVAWDNHGATTQGPVWSFTTQQPTSAWLYRRMITIDHTMVAASLTNFTVLIKLSNDGNLSSHTQPDGDDIYFTDSIGVRLNHEIESFNSSSGTLVVWVKIPTLSITTDTIIYMYYGNLTASNQQNPAGTWDTNFLAVHHLEETSGTLFDSTIHHNDGTPFGGVSQGVAGKIDGACYFDGSNDHIVLPQVYSSENHFTTEAWFFAQSGARYIVSQRTLNGLGVFIQLAADGYLQWYINGAKDGMSISMNKWYYVVLTYDGTTAKLSVNAGAPQSKICDEPVWPAEGMYLGDRSVGNRQFHGILDEVRFSNVARDAGWIATVYNNENNPSGFFSISNEESG